MKDRVVAIAVTKLRALMMMCRRDEEVLTVAKAVVPDVVSVARERRRVITIDGLDIMICSCS